MKVKGRMVEREVRGREKCGKRGRWGRGEGEGDKKMK